MTLHSAVKAATVEVKAEDRVEEEMEVGAKEGEEVEMEVEAQEVAEEKGKELELEQALLSIFNARST